MDREANPQGPSTFMTSLAQPQENEKPPASTLLTHRHSRHPNFLFGEKGMTIVVSLFVWIWMLGFFLFDSLVVLIKSPNPLMPLESVVVFTGSEGRVQTGISLLKRGVALCLLISGVQSKRAVVLAPDEATLPITLGYTATNTVENVNETVSWLESLGFSTAYLVTADYHMPRSLWLLRRHMPQGRFSPYPLKTPSERRMGYTFIEYHKYLVLCFFKRGFGP